MGSIVKSIGKAIGKIGKSIGKLVKKALPIILMAGVAYMGVAAYGAMGSGLTGASAISPSMFTKGLGDLAIKGAGAVSNFFGGGQAMASTAGMGGATGMGMGTAMGQAATVPTPFLNAGAQSGFMGSESFAKMYNGLGLFRGDRSAANLMGSGMSANSAIADAMKYQSDMMWKGNLLKSGGAALTAMFDKSDEIAERNLDITEDEFKRRHTYGGFAMDSGKPSDYAKPGKPGHDPTGFWGQIGGGPPKYGFASNKGGPRQFQQAGLKTPNVNSPGLINSRQGQQKTAGLLGQRNKSVA